MKQRVLFLVAALGLSASAQPWSTFLDSSRAIDWTGVGLTIPSYSVNCLIQPSLTPGDPNAAAANTTAIEKALASCDATHNVVNIPAGAYYVAGWNYGSQGKQVVRGAGPASTIIYLTGTVSCGGLGPGICMGNSEFIYNGNPAVLPPSGSRQCLWTGGYTKGSTTITLSNCGGAPPANRLLVLDQANDSNDTGGIYTCDSYTPGCTYETAGNRNGRTVNGVTHSQQQVVYVTAVTNNGDGTYSATISPGVYFPNIRRHTEYAGTLNEFPGAWWPGFVQNDGLENATVDISQVAGPSTTLMMFSCYQCWERNVRSLYGGRSHVWLYLTLQDIIKDNYFYQSQAHGSQSYGVEFAAASDSLVENNIFQQLTNPIMFGQGAGSVIAYNYGVDDVYGTGQFAQAPYYAHNAGNSMNLWEGNSFYGIWTDDAWGSSALGTYFRNMLVGWQSGKSLGMFPIALRTYDRAFNILGNVLGQPGYQNNYEAYATSPSGGVNAAKANTSIYELGWGDNGGFGLCTPAPSCDASVRSTLMRWGNYDVVSGLRWDPTEASPAAAPYINANFTSSYFSSLAHALPASLYYSSKPSWWPAAKAWPAIGPDVSGGNLGICSGPLAGAQATASGQCPGGSWSGAWAAHANSIPAQDCYLNVMKGPADGTGAVLTFDASACYASPQKAVPPGKLVVTKVQ